MTSHSKRKRPTRRTNVWAHIDRLTREYGGPEEGDWWFTKHYPIQIVRCKLRHAEEIGKRLAKRAALMTRLSRGYGADKIKYEANYGGPYPRVTPKPRYE